MHLARIRPAATLAFVTFLALGISPTLGAQTPTRAVAVAETRDASETRQQLMEVLGQYAPSLGRVLKLDPSLLANPAYLAPYPSLASFLTQHPEIARSPAYFFERVSAEGVVREYRGPAVWEEIMAGLAVFAGVVTILLSLGWVIRTLVDYRRWHRLTKTQAEVHAKLLDRFTGNDEILAYVQSPAGNRFLQSAPISLDPGSRSLGAPFSRILWSVQAGLVLGLAGFGLQYVSWQAPEDAKQPLFAMGVLGISLGAGFVLSAVAAYFLSQKLGLFDQQAGGAGGAKPDSPSLLRDGRE